MMISQQALPVEPADPRLWLEEVDSPRALDWVREHNARTVAQFEGTPTFSKLEAGILAALDDPARIAQVQRMGGLYYNFWRDAAHPRGLWRRIKPADYGKPDAVWETVLDLDALAASEKENWVYKGAHCAPDGSGRCLLMLSRGGADAVVVREFDLRTRAFVADGFRLPEAKTEVSWVGHDEIFVGTDFGPGSLTDSGYPRVIKRWKRGTPLSAAVTVLEGQATDVSVSAWVERFSGGHYEVLHRATSFYTSRTWLKEGGETWAVELPEDAMLRFFERQMLVQLRSDWAIEGQPRHLAGSLLAIDIDAFRAGQRNFQTLFVPTATSAIEGMVSTRHHLIVNLLDKVAGRLLEYSFRDGQWASHAVPAPALGSLQLADLAGTQADRADDYLLQTVDFITPAALYLVQAGRDERQLLARQPALFDATGLHVQQQEAVSKDGTRVPYFIVMREGLAADAGHPTLLYGYGGFEVSLTPWYSVSAGKGWLERGGVYVVANIRGGGEFGPRWHEAALKEKRQNAYDDFIAVAEDLIARGITRPQKLGIMGGSNGGLLMGVMLTQRPDLFGAVVCQVPLLDMQRYNKLLAGASWMAEYGNPDLPEEWAYIRRYSPYQNLKPGQVYPETLFTTSTRDDRVHPGHARKMMAKMEADGASKVWYYENLEGGHAGAADNRQLAHTSALAYTFLWQTLSR
ncbi:prolyl oligopeptidase family protein [Uliginosibacterium paludis]|uniref:Prolyl oligopeptidase family serine peptidase n=1 Tax=Uliginosibacterium paludis TaxID=1615952 RepID=A0ABV2CM16_9RHOO